MGVDKTLFKSADAMYSHFSDELSKEAFVALQREPHAMYGNPWKAIFRGNPLHYLGVNEGAMEFSQDELCGAVREPLLGVIEYGVVKTGGVYIGFGEKGFGRNLSIQDQRLFLPARYVGKNIKLD